jgi:hypothetical protein
MFKKLVKSTIALALAISGSAFGMQKPSASIGLTPAQSAAQKAQFNALLSNTPATGGTVAMPTNRGSATIGLTPAQSAAQKAQFNALLSNTPATGGTIATPTNRGSATIGLTPAQTAAQKERYAQLLKEADAKKTAAQARAAIAVTPAERQMQERQVAEAQEFARELREERDALERTQTQNQAMPMPQWPASQTSQTLPVVPAAAAPAGQVRVYNPFTGTSRLVPAAEAQGWESQSPAGPQSLRSSSDSSSSLSSGSDLSDEIDF